MVVIPDCCREVWLSFLIVVGKSGCHSCSLLGSLGVIHGHCRELWVSFLVIVRKSECHSWSL